jgi:hypothetical protein
LGAVAKSQAHEQFAPFVLYKKNRWLAAS